MSTHSITEAKRLPPITLAQKAELVDLTQALILGEGDIHRPKICLPCFMYLHSSLERERTSKCKKHPYKICD